MAFSLHEFATSELHLFEIPDCCTFTTLEASQVQDSRSSHIRDFEASQVQYSRPSHIRDFEASQVQDSRPSHIRDFEASQVQDSKSSHIRKMLRRFKIPDLRELCVPENSLHEFHISRCFEGDKFS
jgi:hypothetical protein